MIDIVNLSTSNEDSGEYVGRGSVLGNPFSHVHGCGKFPVDCREDAIRAYEDWLLNKLQNQTEPYYTEFNRLQQKYIAEGHLTLKCWCKPLPCHADVIAKFITHGFNNTSRDTED